MIAVYTVLRKELIELIGDRESLSGPLVQGGIVLFTVGVLVPSLGKSIWTDPNAPVVLFQLFPATIASMIAADAFAGERERGTLETLLATPLEESAVFVGKTLAALSVGLFVSVSSLVCALVVANIRFGATMLSPRAFASVIVGSIAASLFTSSVAVAISSRVAVARSAQQIAAMAAIMFVFGSATLLEQAPALSAGTLMLVDGSVAIVALALLGLSSRSFRRDRLFQG